MEKVQILGAPQSPLVWAVRMAAMEKGIPADSIHARPHTPEIDAISPFGKIPVMRHGEVTLAESRAIAFYIDGLSDKNPLVPRDLATAARVEQWIMHFQTEYAPLMVGRYVIAYFFPRGPNGTPDRAVIDEALPPVEKSIAILERQLESAGYLTGSFTLADIFFAPALHYVSGLPEGAEIFSRSPFISAWLGRIASRPAFKATLPPPVPARAAA
jgi:glutathione S-transferase